VRLADETQTRAASAHDLDPLRAGALQRCDKEGKIMKRERSRENMSGC